MQVLDYHIDADLHFNEEIIDEFISQCEDIINHATKNKNVAFKLKIALHELVVNCVEHRYQKKAGHVDFYLRKDQSTLILEVSDTGKGFDHETIDFQKNTHSLEDVNARGWGLLIINRLVDEMHLQHNTPSGTRVTITVVDM